MQKQNAQLRLENAELKTKVNLPADPPLPSHGFGPRLISLAVNLAQAVGLRASERVLKLFRDWLAVDWKLPNWHTIRNWLLRFGLAQIADEATFQRADDWIWMADHSIQIGKEKVFLVMAVRASQLPKSGEALRHEDMLVLYIEPRTEWKCEDVAVVYRELEQRFGTPRGILSDGAGNLQDSVKSLENKEQIPSDAFRDIKHIAANIFKSVLGNDESFQEFKSFLGTTRAKIQQTELAHLAPPSMKPKGRFMNLAGNLRWAEMALWCLKNPHAKAREGITDERIEEKLGWLLGFESKLAEWTVCQRIISTVVKFGAEQGASRDASKTLRRKIGKVLSATAPQQVFHRLLDFWEHTESKLRSGERLPISTDILESSFGLYKSLERQHSKGGFTSLIAAIPALLQTARPQTIKDAFARVSNARLQEWTRKKLGRTLASKRNAAHAEHKQATKRATANQTDN